jgi:hypothetical protein
VLAAATGGNGNSLTLTSATQGKHGAVSESPGGEIVYTPNASFGGFDTFKYTISDGNGGVSTGTVTIETPYYPVKGNYDGLVVNNSQANAGTGFFQATVNYKGHLSGKIILGGSSYSFSAALDSTGDASAEATDSKGDHVGLSLQLPLLAGKRDNRLELYGGARSLWRHQPGAGERRAVHHCDTA